LANTLSQAVKTTYFALFLFAAPPAFGATDIPDDPCELVFAITDKVGGPHFRKLPNANKVALQIYNAADQMARDALNDDSADEDTIRAPTWAEIGFDARQFYSKLFDDPSLKPSRALQRHLEETYKDPNDSPFHAITASLASLFMNQLTGKSAANERFSMLQQGLETETVILAVNVIPEHQDFLGQILNSESLQDIPMVAVADSQSPLADPDYVERADMLTYSIHDFTTDVQINSEQIILVAASFEKDFGDLAILLNAAITQALEGGRENVFVDILPHTLSRVVNEVNLDSVTNILANGKMTTEERVSYLQYAVYDLTRVPKLYSNRPNELDYLSDVVTSVDEEGSIHIILTTTQEKTVNFRFVYAARDLDTVGSD
jgi:hypothetical protein